MDRLDAFVAASLFAAIFGCSRRKGLLSSRAGSSNGEPASGYCTLPRRRLAVPGWPRKRSPNDPPFRGDRLDRRGHAESDSRGAALCGRRRGCGGSDAAALASWAIELAPILPRWPIPRVTATLKKGLAGSGVEAAAGPEAVREAALREADLLVRDCRRRRAGADLRGGCCGANGRARQQGDLGLRRRGGDADGSAGRSHAPANGLGAQCAFPGDRRAGS